MPADARAPPSMVQMLWHAHMRSRLFAARAEDQRICSCARADDTPACVQRGSGQATTRARAKGFRLMHGNCSGTG
eukprot:7003617-Alexandrium_andersonii.AAC.1